MRKRAVISLLFLFFFNAASVFAAVIQHELTAAIDPATNTLRVEDTITLPDDFLESGQSLSFLIHADLNPISPTPGVTIQRQSADIPDLHPDLPLEHVQVILEKGIRTFEIQYAGKIHHPLKEEGENYGRSFRETPGIISKEGVFLAGTSFWFPVFQEALVRFSLDLTLPPGWDAVSQGTRTQHTRDAGKTTVHWASPEPQEEIYLIGGKWTAYQRPAGKIDAMVFLREPDKALAEKYLAATVQYLEMYQKLLGPYPYQKFALVENFWETGYGMPSFTLLGPKIIRMPFILHSSYPHEILHNWWGNSVYVDYEQGNWAEGLTTYLADHLIAEQRGQGSASRRATLQKYTDYVSSGQDFPLTAFRQRQSAATEAVGYGKTLMLFHMLRMELGDDTFLRALRGFYKKHRFQRARFSDLKQAFSDVAGHDLGKGFDQWVEYSGAPELIVKKAAVQRADGEFRLLVTLAQTQAGAPYTLHIPIAVTLKGEEKAVQTTVSMSEKELTFSLLFSKRPIKLDIDPEFDLFRRLSRNELPPALSLAFGSEKILVILPSNEKGEMRGAYDELARSWQEGRPEDVDIQWDMDLKRLPKDRSVWILGWKNQFQRAVRKALAPYGVSIKSKQVRVAEQLVDRAGHSVVITTRHPNNLELALTWLTADSADALPGLARKLPHYGRYSYLGFKGNVPDNMLKGVWPVLNSPLSISLNHSKAEAAERNPRSPLAFLPSLFSENRMMKDIAFLADEKMKGRGFGTPELDQAAEYIRAQFEKSGLKPLGDAEDRYFQSWSQKGGSPEKPATLKNVVGVLPGSNPKYEGESVVVGAHYDHLGLGWPDAHAEDAGKIHPGADDNASGVAVLLELARVLGDGWKPERSVIFAAFSGEEMQTAGAEHYVSTMKTFPPEKIMGMLNMDTVGRLGNNTLQVFGTKTATQWQHIFRGIGFVTGVPIQTVNSDFNPSDHVAFHKAGVPAVQLFSGVHTDFHRPTDTAEKIDPAGLLKVAMVMKEAIEYLSSRPESLTNTLTPSSGKDRRERPSAQRKVAIGTVPDFGYAEEGVRITGTLPDSPAEKAGLEEGDILYWIGKTFLRDIKIFSDALSQLTPGVKAQFIFLRGDEEHTVWIVPEHR